MRTIMRKRAMGLDYLDGRHGLRWLIILAALSIPFLFLTHCASSRSYPRTLYDRPSPFNNIIVLEDENGLRTLYFEPGGARQSVSKPGDPDHLELAYAKTMLGGLALCEEPRRMLIVGLGGGTIPKFLHKYYPQSVIDVVDIDPDVVKVARKFFEFHDDAKLKAFVNDGRKFIEDRPGRYDIIFLDAFGADRIPYHLATREFLLAVKKSLTPRGVALGNIWKRSHNSLYDSMMRTYVDVFDEVYFMDVPVAVNAILAALPRRLHLTCQDIASRARHVSQSKNFLFDMGKVLEGGCRPIDQEIVNGHVLTDAGQPSGSP